MIDKQTFENALLSLLAYDGITVHHDLTMISLNSGIYRLCRSLEILDIRARHTFTTDCLITISSYTGSNTVLVRLNLELMLLLRQRYLVICSGRYWNVEYIYISIL